MKGLKSGVFMELHFFVDEILLFQYFHLFEVLLRRFLRNEMYNNYFIT